MQCISLRVRKAGEKAGENWLDLVLEIYLDPMDIITHVYSCYRHVRTEQSILYACMF